MEMKHPLTLWEKTKIGVGSFFKSVANYVPHALIMTPIFLGGMMLLANATGGLGGLLTGLTEISSVGGFITKALIGIGVGSLIVGGMAAYQGIKANTQFREKEIEMQQAMLAREHARTRGMQRETGDDMPLVASGGLPPHVRNNDLVRD